MNIGRYENSNVDVKIKSIVATILGDELFEDITRICERYSEEEDDFREYGIAHNCMGHTYIIKVDGACSGYILLGEALRWETDPPQMQEQPFYRLMGFVIDKNYRS